MLRPRPSVTCSSAARCSPESSKPALFGARQCARSVVFANAMPFALRHQLPTRVASRCSVSIICARCEPVLAASVLAQRDQIGRCAHCAHHRIELLLPVAVPMHEHGKVAVREGRLLVRDRVERDVRIGDDPLAIALRDSAMFVDALGLKPALHHARGGGADLVLRLQRDALRLQAAMIDARVDIELGQPLIDMLGPAFAPLLDQLGAVPVAHLRAETVLRRPSRIVSMTCACGLASPSSPISQCTLRSAIMPRSTNSVLDEVAGQLDALALVHLARDCELDLARKLRILALLCRLDRVPELLAVGKLGRRAFGQHHFGMNDAGLVGEVMVAVEPLIVQPFGRSDRPQRQQRCARWRG